MKVVCVSGYFDPIHPGHIEYFQLAKSLGDKLIVIINSDHQATLKKGKPFMCHDDREKIIAQLRMVDETFISIDEDRTVCASLEAIKPNVFCNGGDQFNDIIPEREICEKLNIELRDGLGEKIESSSRLIANAKSS